MMKITNREYDNAYNTALDHIEDIYGFDDCGGIEGWAGDALDEFLDIFLDKIGVIREKT